MEENKDFIDEAVERTFKKMLHRAEVRRSKYNKVKEKRKQERQNRRKGRR
jgi:hypothetical protein